MNASQDITFAPGRYKFKLLTLGDVLRRDFLVNHKTGFLVCGCERFVPLNFAVVDGYAYVIECLVCKTTWSSYDLEEWT